MFEKKEDEITNEGQVESVVGASVKLEGDYSSDGDIFIHGNVTGKVSTKASLSVGETAEVKADIVAKNVMVAGRVEGNIKADEKVDITASGKVHGDIATDDLSIASGAVFTGSCQMGEGSGGAEETAEKEIAEEDKK